MTMPEVAGVLSMAMRAVLSGRLSPGAGTAVASLARAMTHVHEVSELEERLASLEQVAQIGGKRA